MKKLIISITLAGVIASIVVVRQQTLSGSTGSSVGDLSRSALFCVMTIIPAVISERLLRRVRELLQQQRTLDALRDEVTITQKTRTRARQTYQEIMAHNEAVEQEALRRRALYDQAYEQAKAQRQS